MADFPSWPGYPGREMLPSVHLYPAGGEAPPFMGTLGVWPTAPIERAVIDVAFSWQEPGTKPRPYLQEGEFITESTWSAPTQIDIGDGVASVGGTIPPAPTIIGGVITQAFFYTHFTAVPGELYTITNFIETSLDRADGRSFTITVGAK